MNNPNNQDVKKKQQRNLIIVILIAIIFFVIVYELIAGHGPVSNGISQEPSNFANPLRHVDAESVILEKTEEKLVESQKKTDELQQKLDALVKNSAEQQKNAVINQDSYRDLQKRFDELEHKLGLNKNEVVNSADFLGNLLVREGGLGSENLINQNIKTDQIALTQLKRTEENSEKNPDNYVAAGTFVRAVMLGGADASAAVNAQANPTPMLFRVLDNGTMPNKQTSHLKGCIATAAVVGDISSERGMVRLETLSCVDPATHKIRDISVEGTVFGPEGKNGIRGVPVWREGALLQRAFLAGTLSGFSNSLSQRYTTSSISPLGSTQTVNTGDIFKYGLANGLGTAMDKLATYNIQRAEQYHPVIQLNAGAIVDLVFLKGFYLRDANDADVKNTVVTNSNIIAQSELSKLPLTLKQIEQLKAHTAELGIKE